MQCNREKSQVVGPWAWQAEGGQRQAQSSRELGHPSAPAATQLEPPRDWESRRVRPKVQMRPCHPDRVRDSERSHQSRTLNYPLAGSGEDRDSALKHSPAPKHSQARLRTGSEWQRSCGGRPLGRILQGPQRTGTPLPGPAHTRLDETLSLGDGAAC